jgi:Uma2 family endonuclease
MMTTDRIASPPPLENGDYLTRAEFERRYEAMPRLKKAELIEGIVYIPGPVRYRQHARPHGQLSGWIGNYEAATPAVLGGNNTSTRLDQLNEFQPDLLLMIEPVRGGQASISEDDFVEGAPEWVGEIAASTVSIDLHAKLEVYHRTGVREYVVWRVQDGEIDWFIRRGQQFQCMTADSAGILRSKVFPGLWLDVPALLRGDLATVLAVVQQGVASKEHAAFVARLNARA